MDDCQRQTQDGTANLVILSFWQGSDGSPTQSLVNGPLVNPWGKLALYLEHIERLKALRDVYNDIWSLLRNHKRTRLRFPSSLFFQKP